MFSADKVVHFDLRVIDSRVQLTHHFKCYSLRVERHISAKTGWQNDVVWTLSWRGSVKL